MGLTEISDDNKEHIIKLVAFLVRILQHCASDCFQSIFLLFQALGLITYINLVSVKLYVKINNIFGGNANISQPNEYDNNIVF